MKCIFDRLPSELLSMIFLLAAHPDIDEDLVLHTHAGSGNSPMARPRFARDRLDELQLSGHIDGICELLAALDTKSITTLTIDGSSTEDEADPEILESSFSVLFDYLRRHQVSLRSFSLQPWWLETTGEHAIEMLKCVPNLESLKVHFYSLTDEDILALTVSGQDKEHIFGAELTDLLLNVQHGDKSLTLNRINDMILSRWRYNLDTEITILLNEDPDPDFGYPMDNPEVLRMCRDGAFLIFDNWCSAYQTIGDCYVDWKVPMVKSFPE